MAVGEPRFGKSANPCQQSSECSDEHPSRLELQTQPEAPNAIVEHQQYALGFCTIKVFAARTEAFYKALRDIAQYLPPEGDSSIEAMQMVTAQRKWMFDVRCAVGQVVGTFYQLEKNTLMELQVMWETGQGNLSVKGMKKNFRATIKNLMMLTEYRKAAQEKIDECKSFANQMVIWKGQEHKMQHAVMELLGNFGGGEQCKALLRDLDTRSKDLSAALEEEKKVANQVAELSGKREELHCKFLVYDSIAANETGSLTTLQERAKKADEIAAQKEVDAAETMESTRWGRLGRWFMEWTDSKVDVAAWRAERFRSIAKAAKQALGDQQSLTQMAAQEAGVVKGELTTVEVKLKGAKEKLKEAAQATTDARIQLRELKARCQELRKTFGGLDLQQIGSLRDHMQNFPELLGAQGMEDHGMFASMEGALKQHERLVNRMETFLEEEDDQECIRILNSLRSVICKAIDDAQFFAERLKPLQDKIVARMNALPLPDAECKAAPKPMEHEEHASSDDWERVTLSADDALW
ncbi:Uncharacterized protein SCF082_LOCUS48449 [Durusdinium trenchii]|uniref:Uncharacterized protein n=1 Tax=Durusdinium trenchii TaxID=1381693 RepID=A0ABP0RVU7_9DINO